jgi:kynurenine formamidase
LLEAGIISFENLANTEKLPRAFTFYGMPLNIKDSDGSPIRAFALLD